MTDDKKVYDEKPTPTKVSQVVDSMPDNIKNFEAVALVMIAIGPDWEAQIFQSNLTDNGVIDLFRQAVKAADEKAA